MDNTPRRSKRLGKGLSALIPEINEEVDKKDIVQVKLSNIRPNKNQPRKEFDQDRIKALSDSIKNVGVLQPIVLKPTDDNKYMIIAGERRYRASIMAGRAAAKRFKVTGTGKLKRSKAYKSHILTKKSTKRKRNLRKPAITDATNVKNMKKILPYL